MFFFQELEILNFQKNVRMTKLSALDKLTRLLCCANHLACPDPGNAPGQKQKTESTSGLLDENRWVG